MVNSLLRRMSPDAKAGATSMIIASKANSGIFMADLQGVGARQYCVIISVLLLTNRQREDPRRMIWAASPTNRQPPPLHTTTVKPVTGLLSGMPRSKRHASAREPAPTRVPAGRGEQVRQCSARHPSSRNLDSFRLGLLPWGFDGNQPNARSPPRG